MRKEICINQIQGTRCIKIKFTCKNTCNILYTFKILYYIKCSFKIPMIKMYMNYKHTLYTCIYITDLLKWNISEEQTSCLISILAIQIGRQLFICIHYLTVTINTIVFVDCLVLQWSLIDMFLYLQNLRMVWQVVQMPAVSVEL